MLNQPTNISPATHVLRPERKDPDSGFWDNISRKITGGLIRALRERNTWMPKFISTVERYGLPLEEMTEEELQKLEKHGIIKKRGDKYEVERKPRTK